MGFTIRKAVAQDAPAWLELLRLATENDYPDKQVYDADFIAAQLQETAAETWIAEEDGVIEATFTFLPPGAGSANPVANIGRHFQRPEAYGTGAASALIGKAVEEAQSRKQLLVSRVLASDLQQQHLYESAGFAPVGFQPYKHSQKNRESVVFYYRLGGVDLGARLPISESIPQVAELAQLSLGSLNLGVPAVGRDGLTGYPLQSDFEFTEGGLEDFDLWRAHAQAISGEVEISGGFNHGIGFLRLASNEPPAAVFAVQNGTVGAGVLCVTDPLDHCVRVLDSFSVDDFSLGPLLNELTKRTLQEAGAYVELDILASAPRLLKTAEQIGFVPVAYFPTIHSRAGSYTDVVKFVKLNAHYSFENTSLSPAAKRVADLIAQNFEDQKVGLAIINLLRGLPFFQGLGDGELRKIARLFTQKMFRAGETIFKKGEYSYDAYVLMRGQVDIVLNEGAPPLAQLGNGEIFGELAFLDGTPRTASAIASQTTIALVIQRTAFSDLARREPHLGMVVFRNIAMELSKRLRKANEVLPGRH
jgi:CRP/FNR family transcriptional regulator, cyclic AMP receptor protein